MQDMLTDSSEGSNAESSTSTDDEMESASEGHPSLGGEVTETNGISKGWCSTLSSLRILSKIHQGSESVNVVIEYNLVKM